MTELVLKRYCYSDTHTEGRLYLPSDEHFYTMERPWIGGVPGGMPFKSCVPDGQYELIPYRRSNGDDVYALRNPDLGVYFTKDEKGDAPGRYKILCHAGNFVEDVVGCIAPGIGTTIHNNRPMVTSSRQAMKRIMAHKWETIIIKPTGGTA